MKTIYNPTTQDFTVKYDIKGDKRPVKFTLKAMEMGEFEDVVAEHITKHLANKILHKRGIKHNPEMDLKNIVDEIQVEL